MLLSIRNRQLNGDIMKKESFENLEKQRKQYVYVFICLTSFGKRIEKQFQQRQR